MTIIRNSAKCNVCGVEIESKHRHDFATHWCEAAPRRAQKWVPVGDKEVLVTTENFTWMFAVDGGKEYLRRVGEGWTDTSELENE